MSRRGPYKTRTPKNHKLTFEEATKQVEFWKEFRILCSQGDNAKLLLDDIDAILSVAEGILEESNA